MDFRKNFLRASGDDVPIVGIYCARKRPRFSRRGLGTCESFWVKKPGAAEVALRGLWNRGWVVNWEPSSSDAGF